MVFHPAADKCILLTCFSYQFVWVLASTLLFPGSKIKGIVSRNFGGLQMILMDEAWVPDVPLEVYFVNFFFHTDF